MHTGAEEPRRRARARVELLRSATDECMPQRPTDLVPGARFGRYLLRAQACMDADKVDIRTPTPSGTSTRDRVRAMRLELAQLQGMYRTGNFAGAIEYGEKLVAEVETLGFGPLTSELYMAIGRSTVRLGRVAPGIELERRALELAVAEKHTWLAAKAATR